MEMMTLIKQASESKGIPEATLFAEIMKVIAKRFPKAEICDSLIEDIQLDNNMPIVKSDNFIYLEHENKLQIFKL